MASAQSAVPCDELPQLEHGLVICDNGDDGTTSYQDVCQYTCVEGFELMDNSSRSCLSTGMWSDNEPTCRRVRCDELGQPANGSVECDYRDDRAASFEDVCRYTCVEGFELIGSSSTICLSNGTWSNDGPTCRTVSCPTLNHPDNGAISCSSGSNQDAVYEVTCSFTCDSGYELTSGSSQSRTCLSDGMWNGTEASCRRVSCPDLGLPNNGTIECAFGDDGVASYQDTCRLSCADGYRLNGSAARTCQSDGMWSGSSSACHRVSCTELEPPEYALINCEFGNNRTPSYQDICHYTCESGFEPVGGISRTCLSNGTWSNVEVICLRVGCVELQPPEGGSVDCHYGHDRRASYQDMCTFTCDTGFELIGSSITTCLSNGTWSGVAVVCTRVSCPTLDHPRNGVVSCSSGDSHESVFEVTCSFTCNPGYELNSGSEHLTCLGNGTWNGIEPICRIVPCDELPQPEHGSVICDYGDDGTTSYQDVCRYTCVEGFELMGSSSRSCLSTGMWSDDAPTCERVSCPTLNHPDDGAISCSSGSNQDAVYEVTCSFTCDSGYELTSGSSQSRTCLSDGMWNGTEASCERVNCPDLSPPNNGTINCMFGDDGVASYQDTCLYTCNRGYQLTGNQLTICGIDGTWDNELITCTIMTCESQIPGNQQLVGDCRNRSYGSNCSLKCSSDDSVSGDVKFMCDINDDGTEVKWRNVSGSSDCNNKYKDDPVSSEDGGGIPIHIVVAAAAGGILLILVVLLCLVVLFVKHSRKKRKYSINSLYSNHVPLSGIKNDCCETDMSHEFIVYYPDYAAKKTYDDHYINLNAHKYSTLERAVNDISETVGPAGDAMLLMEEEQTIYDTPCEDDFCGLISDFLPAKLDELYKSLEDSGLQRFHHADINTLEHLGSGEFGIVTHSVLHTQSGSVQVAAKVLNTNAGGNDKMRFLQEASIMCQFDHSNVIKLYGIILEEPMMILLEYMPCGDLQNFLISLQLSNGTRANSKLPMLLLRFCQEIAAGMVYLNDKRFVHRDLAARNILISKTFVCKIADFGMSRDLLDVDYYMTSGKKIPVKWTAPEALHYRKYSIHSDVWSYGCVLYEIWSLGCTPFEDFTNTEALKLIDGGYRLPPPPGCPKVLYRMMIKCWHPDPRSRPQFGQITKLLAGNGNYLLGWSDEDKQVAGKDGMKLGAPLNRGNNLYHDLQETYL